DRGHHAQPEQGDQGGQGRPPLHPFQSSRQRPGAAGTDGLAAQESRQVVGQVLGALVAPVRVLVQAFQADPFQVAGHLGLALPWRSAGCAPTTVTTLAGFRSRCPTPARCAASIARASFSTSAAAARAGRGVPPRFFSSEPPGQYSSEKNGRPLCSPISNTWTM